jgi:hypothetical protein
LPRLAEPDQFRPRLATTGYFCHQLSMPSITDDRKRRGRPKVGSVSVGVRFPPDELANLDGWIEKQDGDLGRPEAVRRIVKERVGR